MRIAELNENMKKQRTAEAVPPYPFYKFILQYLA